MMGWSGKTDKDPYLKMLQTAVKRGSATNSSRHRDVEFTGKLDKVWTFNGEITVAVGGRMTCRHYGTKIFAVDFDDRLITDFGYDTYSISTGSHIRGWHHALTTLLPFPPFPRDVLWKHRSWTNVPRRAGAALDGTPERWRDFASKAPWVVYDDDAVPWFAWERYNERAADVYWASSRFLQHNQNWRYFRYGWNGNRWQLFFRDADAQRKWNDRNKRNKTDGDLQGQLPIVP